MCESAEISSSSPRDAMVSPLKEGLQKPAGNPCMMCIGEIMHKRLGNETADAGECGF
jgi:hypothetical protein